MKATETRINGTFEKVPGGYSQQLSETTKIFVPDFCASSFDEETGTVFAHCPDYDALEKAKAQAVIADKPGEYIYYYETQQATIGCDFKASLSYYGKHYFLHPLHDGLPRLHGRGITYDEAYREYKVTEKAYDKIKQQYRIQFEMCFD